MAGEIRTLPVWSHLKYALYFTYPEIEKLLLDTASMRETMEYLGPVRPVRVYLECTNRGGTHGDVSLTLRPFEIAIVQSPGGPETR